MACARVTPGRHAQMIAPRGSRKVLPDLPRVVLRGRPKVCRGRQHVFEAARRHSDDDEVVAGKFDWVADYAAISMKQTPPQAIADDDNFGSSKHIFRWLEVAAQSRRDPEYLEEAGADTLAFEAFGLDAAVHRRLPRLKDRHRFERTAALGQFLKRAER
jgi:hypothetical protein